MKEMILDKSKLCGRKVSWVSFYIITFSSLIECSKIYPWRWWEEVQDNTKELWHLLSRMWQKILRYMGRFSRWIKKQARWEYYVLFTSTNANVYVLFFFNPEVLFNSFLLLHEIKFQKKLTSWRNVFCFSLRVVQSCFRWHFLVCTEIT